MTPKEKANQLVEQFKNYVHGYVGSSMLTNHEYPEQIFSQAKKAAMIVVGECINATQYEAHIQFSVPEIETTEYWIKVRTELEALTEPCI
jgi:hypothetical protein